MTKASTSRLRARWLGCATTVSLRGTAEYALEQRALSRLEVLFWPRRYDGRYGCGAGMGVGRVMRAVGVCGVGVDLVAGRGSGVDLVTICGL